MSDSETDNDIALSPDTVFAGNYRLLENIGVGASSSVWKAKNIATNALVCIKVLRAKSASKKSYQRFVRESKTLAKLKHPSIPQVHVFQTDSEGTPFIVTELVEGQSLAELINDNGPLPERRALHIFRQIIECLEYAHSQGIVHRDIKPSNIMIGNNDTVKVIDFGIARLLAPEDASQKLTQVGAMIGSPAYMSPEQCLGEEADARSDIYSLGCLMFECLIGCSAFAEDNDFDTYHNHVAAERKGLASHFRNEAFARIIVKCLQTERAMRYQDAAELSRALEEIEPLASTNAMQRPNFGTIAAKVNRRKLVSSKHLLIVLVVLVPLFGTALLLLTDSFRNHDVKKPTSIAEFTYARSLKEQSKAQWLASDRKVVAAYERAYNANFKDNLLPDAQVLECLKALSGGFSNENRTRDDQEASLHAIELCLKNGHIDERLMYFAQNYRDDCVALGQAPKCLPLMEKLWKLYRDGDPTKDYLAIQVAECYRAMGKNAEALRVYENMLRPGHAANLRADVQNWIAEIRQQEADESKHSTDMKETAEAKGNK